jgi:hypothetical protein
MIQQLKTIQITEYVLSDKVEINLITDCLNYCYHRATKHKTPMTGKEYMINKLRKQLGIIN